MAVSLLAGASWTIMMTTLFVSAQVALPDWVRGRGMAILLTAYFGAMTIGSALWGRSPANGACRRRSISPRPAPSWR